MSSDSIKVLWDFRDGQLFLRVEDRLVTVPELVRALLLSDAGCGLSDDPEADVLRLDQDLRRYERALDDRVTAAAAHVAFGCRMLVRSYATGRWIRRRDRELTVQYLDSASVLHQTCTTEHRRARSWISQVRQFVIDSGVREGLLAEAAAGWRRRPDKPTFVTDFVTVDMFIEADPDRADPAWWCRRSDSPGRVHGEWWRRDGDDDDHLAAPLPRSGPWRLLYLNRTGEVYAHRRAGRKPEEVWLLSSGWTDEEAITALMGELMTHIREPNSLILAAEALHAAERGRQQITVLGAATPVALRKVTDVAGDAHTSDDGCAMDPVVVDARDRGVTW